MNIRAILAALLVITAALPAGAAAAAAPDTDASTPTIQFQTDDGANETDANNTTAGGGENPDFEDDQPPEYADDGTPGAAAGLRVTPIDFGEEWMGTETTDSDAEYATTGPFALFFAVGAGGERTNRAVGRGRPTPRRRTDAPRRLRRRRCAHRRRELLRS